MTEQTNQYDKYYDELKQYLKSVDEDEINLKNMLKRAHAWVQHRCGKFELDHDLGRDLVFNRVRFDWNGALEHFESSFMSDLSSLSFELWGGDDNAEEA